MSRPRVQIRGAKLIGYVFAARYACGCERQITVPKVAIDRGYTTAPQMVKAINRRSCPACPDDRRVRA